MAQFEKEIMGDYQPQDGSLTTLALLYHQRCEEYDKTICTGKDKHGVAVAATGEESTLINRHAREVKTELDEQALRMGYTPRELQQEIIRLSTGKK